MAGKYLHDAIVAERDAPQSAPEPGQVANAGGGFGFAVTEWQQLDRFLILGTEGGSYYAGERELTKMNSDAVKACLRADGPRAVARAVEISVQGRAPKNAPAIYAIAQAFIVGDTATKHAAVDAMAKVCRTASDMFLFCSLAKAAKCFGPSLQRAVRKWYQDQPIGKVAYQVVKYRDRNGFTHRDALLLGRVKPEGAEQEAVLRFAAKGMWTPNIAETANVWDGLRVIDGFLEAQSATKVGRVIELIQEFGLTHDMLPTQWKTDPFVWEALLQKMPMTAMIRNLANMTRYGLLAGTSDATKLVIGRLRDAEYLHKSRVHPMSVLMALRTYQSGRGLKGSNTWTPNGAVVNALDDAFYLAFPNAQGTGQRVLLSFDVSGSMGMGSIAGFSNFTPAEASAAMALVHMAVEDNYEAMAFSCGFVKYPVRMGDRLNEAVKKMFGMPFQSTDCSLPFTWASGRNAAYDLFIVYTDSETNYNRVAPHVALQQYRQKVGVNAKLVVCAMSSGGFSIADPKDGGMLDVVGFDASVPNLVREFAVA